MNEEHIRQLQGILTKWNPLGEKSNQISDLNNYETEATDILFHTNKRNSEEKICKMIDTVLNQAFGLHVDQNECMLVASQVYKMLNR